MKNWKVDTLGTNLSSEVSKQDIPGNQKLEHHSWQSWLGVDGTEFLWQAEPHAGHILWIQQVPPSQRKVVNKDLL